MTSYWDLSNAHSKDNARDKSFEEVRTSFVPPPHFAECALWRNGVLVGPRGSGKTTILKVLAAAAQATEPTHDINYVGVYVPADPGWGRRTRELDDASQIALFKLLVVERFLDVFRLARANPDGRVLRTLQLAPLEEQRLAARFSSTLGLQPVGSLDSVRDKVKALMLRIASKDLVVGSDQQSWVVSENVTDLIGRLVNDLGECESVPSLDWVLLLDELELAPLPVFRSAWLALRNPPPAVRLKLAFLDDRAPDSLGGLPNPPRKGNDYWETPLTWKRRRDYYDFTVRLAEGLYEQIRNGDLSLVAALEDSVLPPSWGGTLSDRNRAAFTEAEQRLLNDDETFAVWARRQEAKSDSGVLPTALRGKVAQTVVLRDAYRARGAGPRVAGVNLYTGAPTILEILEGNPRHVTWLVNALSREMSSSRTRISATAQQRAVKASADLLTDVLKTVFPEDDPSKDSVWELTDILGQQFRTICIEGPFRTDPITAVRISVTKEPGLIEYADLCVQYGGLIEITRPSDTGGGFRRFRLHGLLAALHRLPLKISKDWRAEQFLRVQDGHVHWLRDKESDRLQPGMGLA
ncbi:MAG: hypothetical protein AAF567_06950 [Actinomycetota bacterium]